jgi:hypothetical protein
MAENGSSSVELSSDAWLYPGLAAIWKVPAPGRLSLTGGRLTYSITAEPPVGVIKWVERKLGKPELAERLRSWTEPVDVLDVQVVDVDSRISWTTSWTLLKLKAGGVTWRLRFTPVNSRINAREVAGGKVGRSWRKALRERG